MEKIKAFIGHSFNDEDTQVVKKFTDFFDHMKELPIPFEWDHAENAKPAELSQKVLQKMEDKNTFIGICTKKEKVLKNITLKNSWIYPNHYLVKEDNFEFKTTDWIIQEIGCAIGRDMKLILLIEEGLKSPGGLQGNLEYIEFERAFPEKCFTKITEMITDLLPKMKTEPILISNPSKEPKTSDKVDKPEDNPKDEDLEIQESWTKKDFDNALLIAVVKKDKDKEKYIIKRYIESFGTNDKSIEGLINVKALYFHNWFNNENNFQKIKSISEQYPNNAEIYYYLGKLFQRCNEYDKAHEYFKEAALKTQINKDKMFYISEAILALIDLGKTNYNDLWIELIKLNNEVKNDQFLFDVLTKVGKKNKNDFMFFIGSEALLNENPFEEQTRFDLAYRYSEIEKHELTYFHYNILTEQSKSDTYWNNLGVAANSLNLKAKSIVSYKRAAELEGTLAMSNIAHQYIGVGFLEDAEKICNKALQIKDYDKNIAGAISSIKSKLDYEKEEEKNILEKAKLDRMLLLKFADAYIKPNFKLKSKLWKHPKCKLTVQITDNYFKAQGSFEEKETGYSHLFSTIFNQDAKLLERHQLKSLQLM